jgi:hypothetical protein
MKFYKTGHLTRQRMTVLNSDLFVSWAIKRHFHQWIFHIVPSWHAITTSLQLSVRRYLYAAPFQTIHIFILERLGRTTWSINNGIRPWKQERKTNGIASVLKQLSAWRVSASSRCCPFIQWAANPIEVSTVVGAGIPLKRNQSLLL